MNLRRERGGDELLALAPSARPLQLVESGAGDHLATLPTLSSGSGARKVGPRATLVGDFRRTLQHMRSFVGRGDELAALAEIDDAAVHGEVAAAIVLGEPGSGKSRLLVEAAARSALSSQFRVVGFEPESEVPLASASDFIRALASATPQGLRLEELVLGVEQEGGSPLDPLRIFEAAHRALRAIGPALVLVDDLQWVDNLSLTLCHYVVRAAEASGHSLALIAVGRPSPNATSFSASLEQLPAERLREIELGPLARDEALELVKARAPSLGDDAARALADRSGGSPFWIEALVRSAGAEADAGRLVTARLRGASADAGTLLALLAIAARPLLLADAAVLSGWEGDRTERAARELLTRGIAVESGASLRLAHDLIRAAAAREIPDEQRPVIHRLLGDWLARIAGSDVRLLREAVGHRHAAGLGSLDLATRLARSPQRRLLGPYGLRLLASIADEADPFDADALALHEEVASLATELADHEEALERWSIVAQRAELPVQRASALLAASRAAYGLALAAEARELLERSREVEANDEVLRLERLTHESAILLWLEQRTVEGQALARDVVAAAARLTAGSGSVAALDVRARRAYIDALQLDYEAAVMKGDRERMLRAAEARESVARGFDLEAYLAASLAVCLALRQNGRVREAITRGRNAWLEAERRVLPRLAVDAGFWLARSLALKGALSEAERVIDNAAEVAARAGDVPRARHRVARQVCAIALERGRPRDALRRLETTEETNEHQRIMLHGDLALWYARLDAPTSAAKVVEQVVRGEACADAVGCVRCAAELQLFAAEALARVGRRQKARRALSRWTALDVREVLDDILYLHASALAEDGAQARANALEAALAAAEASPFGLVTLWIRLDLGRELAAAGDERTVTELERLVGDAYKHGALTVRELAEQALRRLGVRTWRRGAAAEQLTAREHEIVRLIATGASNPDIASQLFLSRKTVERHVSNALKKVGARNRAELAARVAELEVEGVHR
jgi:DNA-binding CsgD family transcriptional regulator